MFISNGTAMKLFDAYKATGKLTTYQPTKDGKAIAKFWTTNLSFVLQYDGSYDVTVKKGKSQSALVAIKEYIDAHHQAVVL